MFHASAIEKTPDKKYKVNSDLFWDYKAFLEEQGMIKRSGIKRIKKQSERVPKFFQDRKVGLADWIARWRKLKRLGFSFEHNHFFLEGRHLDDISKELIGNAKTEVLVVNPYVDTCSLSDTLIEASKAGAQVRLVTRPPEDAKEQYKRKKQEYHEKLQAEGVTVLYDNKVHAKLIVVDRAVAVISSMNFYSISSGGASWEAGLISLEETVVESVVDSILKLHEEA